MSETASAATQPSFLCAQPAPGALFDLLDDPHPTLVSSWNRSRLSCDPDATHFGVVGDGAATITCDSGTFHLHAGMYFCIPGAGAIEGHGFGFVASLAGYEGMFQIGGPVEDRGRLRYIDGCSDSLLVAPPVLGDPCLNLLSIPKQTNQTAHTHPSLRVGMILAGQGICRTPAGDVSLTPGLIFVIRTDGLHSFHTTDSHLQIVAWHPDSDFGPTHDEHPMLNRTLVDGQPYNSRRD